MKFIQPTPYSKEEMTREARISYDCFIRHRTSDEERHAKFYDRIFQETANRVKYVLERTSYLTDLERNAISLLQDGYLDILRYMDRPTVSQDDFKNLSGVVSTAPSKLAEPSAATLAINYIKRTLNTNAFPWLENHDEPSYAEIQTAIHIVAALVADQRTKTVMRTGSSKVQENTVRDALVQQLGFRLTATHPIASMQEMPAAGEVFDKETSINNVKADIVLGLPDGRCMALECKVSNSTVNSYKRLNHEVVDKVEKWHSMFGTNGIVGGCVLQGVFSLENLISPQDNDVAIFWSHDLQRLIDFVASTQP